MARHSSRRELHPSPQALQSLYESLMRLPNVTGAYFGRKRRGGRRSGAAIVCLVKKKVSLNVIPEGKRVPKTVPWLECPRTPRQQITDVVPLSGRFRFASCDRTR